MVGGRQKLSICDNIYDEYCKADQTFCNKSPQNGSDNCSNEGARSSEFPKLMQVSPALRDVFRFRQ